MSTSEVTNIETAEEDTLTEEELALVEIETDKVSHQEQIETVIYSLEENDSAMVLKNEDGYLWKFQYGSVEVFVQLTGENEEDLLTVWAVVLELPAKNEPELMKKLLEMNWSGTFETYYAIFNNKIVVSTQRTVIDLSATEISRAITLVATIADDNDDELQSKYGNGN